VATDALKEEKEEYSYDDYMIDEHCAEIYETDMLIMTGKIIKETK